MTTPRRPPGGGVTKRRHLSTSVGGSEQTNPIVAFGQTWHKATSACWGCSLPPGPWPSVRDPISVLIADAYLHHDQGPKAIYDWLRGPLTEDPRTGAGYDAEHPDPKQRLTWSKVSNHVTAHLRPLKRRDG